MEFIIAIISLILWIVLIIRFFQMANDIHKIKLKIGADDSEYYRYIGLAREEHYLGNTDKEREYLIRALSHACYEGQDTAIQKKIEALDGKVTEDTKENV